MRSNPLAVLATAALAPALAAQAFIPVPGGAVPVTLNPTGTFADDDEGLSNALALGFSFPLPSGGSTTMVEATTNGRLGAAGTLLTSDFSPSIAELLGNPESICPLWFDLDSVEVFFDTASVPGVAVITWQDCIAFGGAAEFSFQAQLSSTGDLAFVYDDRVTAAGLTGGIVGFSPGTGAADPGSLDLTSTVMSPAIGGPTIYEDLLGGTVDFAAGPMGAGFLFTLFGPGSYQVTGNTAAPFPASAVPGRDACTTVPAAPFSLTLTPMGAGFAVTPAGAYDAAAAMAGASLGLTDDSVVTQALSFSFPLPGGPSVTSIDVTDNGRIFQSGQGVFASFTPTAFEFINTPAPQIAALWADLDPMDPASGDVTFFDDGTRAVISWVDQAQFGEPHTNTFQVQLLPSGSIILSYESIGYTTQGAFLSPALAGISPGFGPADPEGESDLSAGALMSADALVFEEFDPSLAELVDFAAGAPAPNDSATLFALSPPVVGTDLIVDTADTTFSAVGVAYLFGFPTGLLTGPINLGFLDPALANCEVLVDIITPGALLTSPTGTPGVPTSIVSIPNSPALLGVSGLVVSGLVLNPAVLPSLFPLDELVITFGNV